MHESYAPNNPLASFIFFREVVLLSTIRCQSTREEKKRKSFRDKYAARTVVGTGEKNFLSE